MKDTLVIMGSHPRTREEFDYKREDCDLWVFNEAVSNGQVWAQKATAVFQMHVPAIWRNPQNRNDPGHFDWLKSQNEIPVYMQSKYEDVPSSLTYPINEVIARFKLRHFTSSVAYALALAAYLGTYKRVEIYGVEMETNTEYQYQRDGVTLWIGVLAGMGIDVDAHISMFDNPLYGYEGEVSLPYETFTGRIDELKGLVDKYGKEYSAASLMLQRVVENFISVDNTKDISDGLQNLLNLSKALGSIDGAMQENERYKGKADVMREASGGEFIFSRQEFESSAKNLTDKASEWQTNVNTFSGQGDLIHQSIVRTAKNSPKRRKLLDGYKSILMKYLQAHNQAMVYAGAAQENYRYMQRLDKSIRAAGGAKSEAVLLEAMKAGQDVN